MEFRGNCLKSRKVPNSLHLVKPGARALTADKRQPKLADLRVKAD
jgi:hypothetical protein